MEPGMNCDRFKVERMDDSPYLIRDLEVKIRGFIGSPRLQHVLMRDLAAWNVLCSSLDVIGDSHMAISTYEAVQESNDDGLCYLFIYGILQALYVQQNAVWHILEALNIKVPGPDQDLSYVRDIRNRATGHPTKRESRPKQNLTQRSHFITRFTLRTTGFHLATTYEDRQTEFTEVDILDLIRRQRVAVIRMLTIVVKRLREREVEHRTKFKDKKLVKFFPQTLDYQFNLVFEACRGNDCHKVVGVGSIDLLTKVVTEFKQALAERGILTDDDVKQEIDDVEYALGEIERYFKPLSQSTLDGRSSKIFAFFVEQKFKELKKIAEQIDEEYASPVTE